MKRIRIDLDNSIHTRLLALAQYQDRSLSDLVREAVITAYGSDSDDERRSSLKAIAGLWKDRRDLPVTRQNTRRLRRDTRRKRFVDG